MKKLSRRAQAFADKVVPGKHYSIPEAVEILEELSSEKFKESYKHKSRGRSEKI